MTLNRASRLRRTGAAALIAATLLGATACSAISEQATTKTYAASDGYNTNIKEGAADVQLRNMMLVTNGKDKPARLLGTVVNNGEDAAEVSVAFSNGEKAVIKAAAGTAEKKATALEEDANKAVIKKSPAEPGSDIEVTITVNGVEKKTTLPVQDGSLEQYRQYLPDGYTPAPSAPAEENKGEGEAKH